LALKQENETGVSCIREHSNIRVFMGKAARKRHLRGPGHQEGIQMDPKRKMMGWCGLDSHGS